MILFAYLKSKKHKKLENIGETPIIGTFLILLFSIFPSILLSFFNLPKAIETPLFYSIASLWCFILTKYEVYIKLFFLPAWVLLLILAFLTSL